MLENVGQGTYTKEACLQYGSFIERNSGLFNRLAVQSIFTLLGEVRQGCREQNKLLTLLNSMCIILALATCSRQLEPLQGLVGK